MNNPQYGELASQGREVPGCRYHSDRISYVKCQRCDGYICPECQRPAAIGVQCPACFAREQASQHPVAGKKRRTTVSTDTPFVTYGIIITCALVFLLQVLSPRLTQEISFIPNLTLEQPWRVLTSAFAHDTGFIMHILFNMYALWIVGRELELFLGHTRFAALYFISLLSGALIVLLWSGPLTQTIGASGAIFGLFGALLVVQKVNGSSSSLTQVALLVGINLFIGFTVSNISWQGHVGGLVGGLIAAIIMAVFAKNSAGLWSALAVLAIVIIIGYYVIFTVKGYPLNCLKDIGLCYDRRTFFPEGGL